MTKRLRMFSGPNGSGKSTFIRKFPVTDKLTLGVYVNADDIEATLKRQRCLELKPYQIQLTTNQVHDYFKSSQFAPVKLEDAALWKKFSVYENTLRIDDAELVINSYIAADIAELIRQELVNKGISFSFETVMSDSRKLDFVENAKQNGYRIYLYYFSTEDPEININRVSIRVALDGHHVSEEIIKKRYKNSLENLKEAVRLSDRAYLFDNSGKVAKMILEVENGIDVTVIEPGDPLPNWVNTYLIEVNKIN
jgi:predicted ABC-type ATPase